MTGKYIAPPLSAEQAARTRTELAALAARLPAHLRLTPPATWAQYAGTTPEYAEDVVSCPHVAATLGAELGQKWTYAFGKLPQGPAGCNWTPVPWVPDRLVADRLFVTLGYQAGEPARLLAAPGYCAGGVTAPVLAVPAVGSGAVVDGCLDDDGTQLELDVADPAGTGVWTVSTYAGQAQSTARAADSLLALISAVRRVYG
jgi:hypothetical protein